MNLCMSKQATGYSNCSGLDWGNRGEGERMSTGNGMCENTRSLFSGFLVCFVLLLNIKCEAWTAKSEH